MKILEVSLEVKLPTVWTDEKQRWEESEKRREERRSKRESLRRKKIQVRKKVGKSRNTVFFQWFVAPVGSLKRWVRSRLARWEMKNCTTLWRKAHFQVKMYKTHHARSTFGSWDVEKVRAVVARSTFPSQNGKKNARIWTAIAGFRVQSASRYTTGPADGSDGACDLSLGSSGRDRVAAHCQGAMKAKAGI